MISRRSLLILFTALAVAVAPAASNLVDAQGKGTIKIASQSPLSGELAALGEGIKLGTQLALEQLKGNIEKQGFKVELVPFDDQAKPEVGVANAKNIIADKDVLAVIGHLNSGVAIPSSEVYKEAMLVMVSPANTNPTITDRGHPNVNRVCGRDDVQGIYAANYMVDNKLAEKIAILHDKSAYGQGLADEFKKQLNARGVDETMYEAITAGDKDFTALITKMKQAGVDLIYLGGYHTEAGLIARQASEQGINATMMSGDALVTDEYWAITGDTGQGTLMTFSPDPRKNEAAAPVVAEFEASGYDPEGYTLYTYATIQVWAQAAEQAGSTELDAVLEQLHGNQFETVLGTISFDDKGDVEGENYVMYEWDNGQYVQKGS